MLLNEIKQMIKIDYKSSLDKKFKRYISIGYYDWEIPFDYYLPKENQTPFSIREFKEKVIDDKPSAKTMEIINAIVHDYTESGKDFFDEIYVKEMRFAIERNEESINRFFQKWYEPNDFKIFKGLNLANFKFSDSESEYEIIDIDSNTGKVIFKDGAILKEFSFYEGWEYYYVLERDYDEFKKDYEKLIMCF